MTGEYKMKDQFNRNVDYMRISLTENCNYACSYCRDDNTHVYHDYLSYEEIFIIVKAAVNLGVHKFKITGGEPLVRKDVLSFIEQLKAYEGVDEVTLTTNGSLLSHEDIKRLQIIDGINFSLDTLNEERYYQFTKSKQLHTVIDNILYAHSLKIKVKINCVLHQEISYQDILDLLMFAKKYQLTLRFIELMPMKKDSTRGIINKQTVLEIANSNHLNLIETHKKLGNGPAHYYQMDDIYIGFIEPIHGKFCEQCNRIRLTASGFLKACLFHDMGCDLKEKIRKNEDIELIMKDVIYAKPASHYFEERAAGTAMNEIGG